MPNSIYSHSAQQPKQVPRPHLVMVIIVTGMLLLIVFLVMSFLAWRNRNEGQQTYTDGVVQQRAAAVNALICPVREITVVGQWDYRWVSFCPFKTLDGVQHLRLVTLKSQREGMDFHYWNDTNPAEADEIAKWISLLDEYESRVQTPPRIPMLDRIRSQKIA